MAETGDYKTTSTYYEKTLVGEETIEGVSRLVSQRTGTPIEVEEKIGKPVVVSTIRHEAMTVSTGML